MKTEDSLKRTEKRLYRSYYSDGVYDILAGFIFIIFAWSPIFASFGIPSIHKFFLGLAAIVGAILIRKFVIVPRMGFVKFGQKRQAKRWTLIAMSVAIIFLIMPLMIAMDSEYNIVFIGPIVALIVCIAAYFLDFPRLYIYGALLAFGIIESMFIYPFVDSPVHTMISFGIPGVVVIAYGITLLYKFLGKYPKPEESHVEG